VRACLLFFLNLAQQESVYRHLIINTTVLLKRCVEFTVSQSIYTLVRIVSCQLLQTLSVEREKQMYLVDFLVPSAFFTTLNGTPSAQLRVAAATGLLNFSENPGMVPHVSLANLSLATFLIFYIFYSLPRNAPPSFTTLPIPTQILARS
jgi:hypothetical protein